MKKTVELRPAFTWTCDDCGRDNFLPGIIPEMSNEDREDLKDEFGSADEEDCFLLLPDNVTCKDCGNTYDVEFGMLT